MSRAITFVTGNAGKLAEMTSSGGYPKVQLIFPKHCTLENLSLFSGFKATIPHLLNPQAKERYKVVELPTAAPTKGQKLTSAILAASRRNRVSHVNDSSSPAKNAVCERNFCLGSRQTFGGGRKKPLSA
ncbi:unnamed protein product [Strongylus vulgaris]|uniref:Uncharacterized protein n=1 Tax=Strongylus vulgaris TaxID=40348 RepID=A0A3P7I8T6_STRVU|nr:unnamed protein product [Strongylus vulgaris]